MFEPVDLVELGLLGAELAEGTVALSLFEVVRFEVEVLGIVPEVDLLFSATPIMTTTNTKTKAAISRAGLLVSFLYLLAISLILTYLSITIPPSTTVLKGYSYNLACVTLG